MIRRLLASAAVALLGGGAVLLGAGPASAHNVLEGTDPADGSTVAVAPPQVSLTFNEPALALGSQVVVTAPDGTVVSTGDVQVVDAVVTQPVSGTLPAGVYTVQWRVTSDDGHPIDGVFSFTASGASSAGATAEPEPTATPAATPTATAPAPTATASEPVAAPDGDRDASAVSPAVLAAVGAGVVVVAGVVAWALLRRPRTGDGTDGDAGPDDLG